MKWKHIVELSDYPELLKGKIFIAWQVIPTWDEDARNWVNEESPVAAQVVFDTIYSIPLHYVPQGQYFTHFMEVEKPNE